MGFALIIYRYGMDTAMMKYAVQKEGSERKKYITLIIVTQFITSFLFTLIIYFTRLSTAEYVLGTYRPDWISYLAVILFFDALWNLPLLILRSEEKAIPYIFLSLLNVILTMALNVMFVVYWEQGIEGVFRANIIASAFIFLVSLPRAPISAMPPALSAIGPYASMALVIPTVASIPTAAIPTP